MGTESPHIVQAAVNCDVSIAQSNRSRDGESNRPGDGEDKAYVYWLGLGVFDRNECGNTETSSLNARC